MTRSALNPMRVGSLNEPNEKVWCASSQPVRVAACMPVVEDVLHQDISSRAASSEIW